MGSPTATKPFLGHGIMLSPLPTGTTWLASNPACHAAALSMHAHAHSRSLGTHIASFLAASPCCDTSCWKSSNQCPTSSQT